MDINGDGIRDILSGSYSRMDQDMAGLFQVLYGEKDGTFRRAEVLNGTDGEPLIIPIEGKQQQTENICTRPFAVDWDSDGHLDLVVGNFAGTFYWFKGEGQGKFTPEPAPIDAAGSRLRISGAHSDPFVIDWDGDGDLDLLSGSSNGGVQWAENHAGQDELPKFKTFEVLVEAGRRIAYGEPLSESDLKGPTTSTRVWADDVNSDGKLDLLVGDSVTLVSPADGLSVEEFKKRHADWQKEFQAAMEAFRKATDDEERQTLMKEYNEVYKKQNTFMTQQRTGFVWLYLQD